MALAPRYASLALLAIASATTLAQVPAPEAAVRVHEVDPVIDLESAIARGEPTDAIVVFDDTEVERTATDLRRRRKLRFDNAEVLAGKARGFARLKSRAMGSMDATGFRVVRDFSHLPMVVVRFTNRRAFDQLRARPEFRAAVPNGRKYPMLDSTSAALVGQPATQALGLTGAGTTVLVVDAGVDYTQADFGPCTAPGTPSATCKVTYASNISGTGGNLDTSVPQHGTNIAGIVVGVAPATKIASINVFGVSGTTTDALVLQAINWGIANQAAYNIRAINLSLGDGSFNTAPCSNPYLNPYVSAVNNARAAGILTIAAAGNEGYTSALANPACTPQVISVGAVYSQNWGTVNGSCTDTTTAADQVACFSNSASYLSLLAPGAFITAGGRQLGGTSQATPFVAGAVAVLRAAYATESLDQTVARMTANGVAVTDGRNGITKPRLHVFDSVRPGNDDFADRFTGSGSTGSVTASNVNASKETGEPSHAGNAGGRSVWWRWTAPATGQVALDTHGSGVDTLLGVYTGSGVAALQSVASNDNDGFANGASGLYFQAQAGTEYGFVVDGKNAGAGAISLAWNLNSAATANLRISTAIYPSTIPSGENVYLTVTVTNDGPQPATGVQTTGTLPPQLAYVTGDASCSIVGTTFTCSFGTLLANTSRSATLSLRAVTTGTVQLTAVASSQVTDPVATNNSSSTQVAVGPASLSIPVPPWSLAMLAVLLVCIGVRAAPGAARSG